MSEKITTIDEYIAGFPEDVQIILQNIRKTIHAAAPEAQEALAYGIPTFKLHGNLVHFGGFKKHVSFFPTASGVERFQEELSAYKISKGTVQFPLDAPIPYDLIGRITAYRRQENLEKAASGKKKS